MEAPTALWATISENKSEVKPLYASMAGDDPASGKNWSSKPKQQVNAWNRTMQHTYHTYIPESYQTLPSKAATIRASSAASNKEQKFKGYSEEFLGLAKFTHFLLKCWWWSSNFWLGHFLQEEAVSSSRSMNLFFEAPFLNQGFPNFQRRLVEVWWTGKGRHERCEAGLPSAQPFGWWVKHAEAQWICRQATERVQELNCNPDNAGFHVGFCIMFFFLFLFPEKGNKHHGYYMKDHHYSHLWTWAFPKKTGAGMLQRNIPMTLRMRPTWRNMEAVRRAKMERSTFRVPALHRVTIQKGQMAGRKVAGIRSMSGGTQQNGKGVVVGCMEIRGRG